MHRDADAKTEFQINWGVVPLTSHPRSHGLLSTWADADIFGSCSGLSECYRTQIDRISWELCWPAQRLLGPRGAIMPNVFFPRPLFSLHSSNISSGTAVRKRPIRETPLQTPLANALPSKSASSKRRQCLLCDIFPRSCDFLLIPSPPLLHPICILPTFPLRPMQGWSWAGLTSLGVAPACASGFDHCLHRRLPFTASFPAEATGSPCRAQQSVLSLSLSPSLHRRSTLDLVCLTPQFPRSTWYYHPTLSSPL